MIAKYSFGDKFRNIKSNRKASVHEVFPYSGPDTDWQEVVMYRVLVFHPSGKGSRFQYVKECDIDRLFNPITNEMFWQEEN